MKRFAVLTGCLAVLVGYLSVITAGRAQTPAPPPNYDKLEEAITRGFFTTGPATAGNDWCFQIESDPNQQKATSQLRERIRARWAARQSTTGSD